MLHFLKIGFGGYFIISNRIENENEHRLVLLWVIFVPRILHSEQAFLCEQPLDFF